jgi:hypothetical protein
MALSDRLKHAWNAFANSDSAQNRPFSGGGGGYGRPERTPLRFACYVS